MVKELYESFSLLNEHQREAVENTNKALLLNASVGSGKTTVLVHKVLYLYHIKKVPLRDMAVLTFTNKAAEEIKDRVLSTEPDGIGRAELNLFGTFHSVARYLLSNMLPVEDLGYTKDFTIVDQDGLAELYDTIINSNNLNIKYKKKLEKRLESLREGKLLYGNMKYDDEIQKLVGILTEEKIKRNVMDFDDLIQNCSALLRNSSFKPSWVIIDEFQDTDSSQLHMIDSLVGEDTHVFAVGDPNQIIYTWRGSREDIFSVFKERYGAEEMTLPLNYRSTETILSAARSFLNNPQSLEGMRDKGNPIVIRRHFNAFNEALYMSDVIKRLHSEGVPYREIAVFYRKQKQSAVFEDVFLREGIPYEVSVRKTIRDIAPLYWFARVLRGSVNNKDIDSMIYAVSDKKYGLGLNPVQVRKALNKKNVQYDKLSRIIRRMFGFKEWCCGLESMEDIDKNIYEYFDIDSYLSPTSISYFEDRQFITKYLNEIMKFIDVNKLGVFEGIKSSLGSSTLYGSQIINEIIDPEKESVKLMTLHASKGLEFEYVFISGANYGIIPLGGRLDDEEEKRLFFVGITRAKDYLEISYHSNPEDYNALPDPSPYLKMIPDNLIESDEIKIRAHKLSELRREIKNNIENKRNDIIERKLVTHPKYGEGYIVSEDDENITVKFDGYGEKSFSRLFCPLNFLN
jgi:Superfamily I DNA and RNA helicases